MNTTAEYSDLVNRKVDELVRSQMSTDALNIMIEDLIATAKKFLIRAKSQIEEAQLNFQSADNLTLEIHRLIDIREAKIRSETKKNGL